MNWDELKFFSQQVKQIRSFFDQMGFHEIFSPPLVENPGFEAHIHPFLLTPLGVHKNYFNSSIFLHTSPEFFLKKCLKEGGDQIYSMNYAFRAEPTSIIHRPQFIMLEWYRLGSDLQALQHDCQCLLQHLIGNIHPMVEKNLDSFFMEILGVSLKELATVEAIKKMVGKHFPKQALQSYNWDDCYTLLMSELIEPHFKKYPNLIIRNFPKNMAALASIHESDTFWCNRFEWYLFGIEIANCYQELTAKDEVIKRFKEQNEMKKNIYQYLLPEPLEFYNTMENYPSSCGIALGVERLLSAIFKKNLFTC